MAYAHLDDRSVIALAGEDAIAFLQGLITNDAAELTQGKPLYAALLSPQGKFLHDFFLVPSDGRILLDVNKDRAADLSSRLAMYKLRSRVTIIPLPDLKVIACWNESFPQSAIPDPRLPALGARLYQPHATTDSLADYEAHRISLGVPDGAKDMFIDKSLLLEFGLDKLHGVNFSKGCYVGQEVTARSKFRGQVRKALYQVSSKNELPPMGTPIEQNDKTIGELRSVAGNKGLALLRSEELDSMKTATAAGVALTCRLPSWV